MEIASHSVSFSSKHTSSSSHLRRVRLEMWRGDNPHRNNNRGRSGETPTPRTPDASQLIEPDRVSTKTESTKKNEASGKTDDTDQPETPEELELKILLKSVSAMLDNTNLTFRDPSMDRVKETYENGEKKIEDIKQRADRTGTGETATATNEEADWGLRYDSYERYEEQESLSFNASGKVKTADGETIDFSVSLEMNRQYVKESETHIRAGNAQPIDPLVVNYDGNAAELSTDQFQFDLDMDGTLETLNTLKSGSGFLAMDKNGNGTIDDGSELFGPETGNGFEELATYDSDGNRFIDEGDAAYQDLYLLKPTEKGMRTVDLEEFDVGAIFLGSSDTSFSFKDDLELQGQLRRSGIFISENGETGTVQQIDLVPEESRNITSESQSGIIDVSG